MLKRPLKQKTIGILGGASDVATVEYYKLLNHYANQKFGGNDIAETLIAGMNFGNIEKYIQNNEKEKLKSYLSANLDKLITGGADIILCASNTLHEPLQEILAISNIPFVHIVDPTGERIKNAALNRVILFGTKPVMQMAYIKELYENSYNLEIVTPQENEQNEINHIIFTELVKSKFKEKSKNRFLEIANRLVLEEKAEGLILGCTEIYLLINQEDHPNLPMFNTAELHCEAAIKHI